MTSFKQICDKEEESGVRKSGRRLGQGQGGPEDKTPAALAADAGMTPKPSLNSAGIYVPSSKKKAMPALLRTTHGLPARAVAAAVQALCHNARPVLGSLAGAGVGSSGGSLAGVALVPKGSSMSVCTAARAAALGLSEALGGVGGAAKGD